MNKYRMLILGTLILINIVMAFSTPLVMFVDEGNYLLIAKKMLDGWVPYRDIIDNKPLGMYLALMPAVLLGGTDIVKLRLYAAFVVGLTSFFIFLIIDKIGGRKSALLGAGMFVYMEAFPWFCGYYLVSESLSNLAITALFYILLCLKPSCTRIFLIGVLAAVAFSIRQTSFFVLIPIAFAMWHYGKRMDRKLISAYFLAGVGVIIIPMLLYLLLNSALDDAVYWCFVVFMRSGGPSWSQRVGTFFNSSFALLPFMLSAILSLWSLALGRRTVWIWLICSLIMTQMGYAWMHNYLIIIPPLSILSAIGLVEGPKLKATFSGWIRIIVRGVKIVLFCGMLLLVFAELIDMKNTMESSRDYPYLYWENQRNVSEFISSNTDRGEGIFVFRHNSEIYYLSGRDPVTKMSFFFGGWTKDMNMEEMDEFIFRPLEERKPKYFIFNKADFEIMYKGETASILAKKYLDEKYKYVMESGPLQVYERKEGV